MGIGDGAGGIAGLLARLTQSPQVRYIGSQLEHMLPMGAQPFRLNNNNNNSNSHPHTGASSNIGTNIGGIAGTIAGALGGGQQQQQQDPLMALYAQLLDQLQSPVAQPQGINKEDLMRQVQAALNPVYDARENTARGQADRGTKDIHNMYQGLSQDYQKLAPEQIKQAGEAQKQVEQLYGTLRSNIEGSYSRVSKEQGDLFKSLGIEAALPDVLNKQAAPVQEASAAASENQAQQSQRYMDMGQIDSTFYREGAPNAVLAGNEQSTGLLNKLQDYIQQTEGDRSSGIQTAYMDQLGQAQSQLGQQQQTANSETARRQEMLWQMLQGQLGGKQQQALTPDSFMSTLPGNVQQSVAGAFTQLQRSPEAVYGKVEDKRNPVPGSFVQTTPEWYMQQADQMYQQGSIDATTHQALLMYLQLNFKTGQ